MAAKKHTTEDIWNELQELRKDVHDVKERQEEMYVLLKGTVRDQTAGLCGMVQSMKSHITGLWSVLAILSIVITIAVTL